MELQIVKKMGELKKIWRLGRFNSPELDCFADKRLERDTREGVMTLSAIFLGMFICGAFLVHYLGLNKSYFTTCLLLSALSLHVLWASRTIKDLRALYLLGMNLLVISSMSFVLLAHRTGDLNLPVLASIILVFAGVPLIPWGLREALTVILLVYFVYTGSIVVGKVSFDNQTLLVLQFFLLSSAVIGITMVARNALVRRVEIRSIFELQLAHAREWQNAHQDSLTGSWNRRYLYSTFDEVARIYRDRNQPFYFVLTDINKFKGHNDTLGHDFGDQVLQAVVTNFNFFIKEPNRLFRVGGDEFVLLSEEDPEELIDRVMQRINDFFLEKLQREYRQISLSFGVVKISPVAELDLSAVFKCADVALYMAKVKPGKNLVRQSWPLS